MATNSVTHQRQTINGFPMDMNVHDATMENYNFIASYCRDVYDTAQHFSNLGNMYRYTHWMQMYEDCLVEYEAARRSIQYQLGLEDWYEWQFAQEIDEAQGEGIRKIWEIPF